MAQPAEFLLATLGEALPGVACRASEALGETTLHVPASHWLAACTTLRDHPALAYAQLTDLCAIDWSDYAGVGRDGSRYGVVVHLLSVEHNHRLRVHVACPDDDYPMVDSLVDIWPVANWFEREAFDVMGVVFSGHPDLRRLLTDYGFVGHPFRKDFPISGHVEMRYDPEQQRVVYQPVSIDPRNNVPRIVREEHYGDTGD